MRGYAGTSTDPNGYFGVRAERGFGVQLAGNGAVGERRLTAFGIRASEARGSAEGRVRQGYSNLISRGLAL